MADGVTDLPVNSKYPNTAIHSFDEHCKLQVVDSEAAFEKAPPLCHFIPLEKVTGDGIANCLVGIIDIVPGDRITKIVVVGADDCGPSEVCCCLYFVAFVYLAAVFCEISALNL